MIASAPGNAGDGDGDAGHHRDTGPPPPNVEDSNGAPPYHQHSNNITPNTIGRRHQLYVGNLSWVRTVNTSFFHFYDFHI